MDMANNEPAGEVTLESVCLSDVEAEPINWVWRNHLARGKIALLVGVPGQGKSMLTLDFAMRVSRGAKWPDDTPGGRPASVLVLSVEDTAGDTIKPRLEFMGANVKKLYVVTASKEVSKTLNEQGEEVIKSSRRPINLRTDIAALRKKIDKIGNVELVIFDPLSAYLGGVNTDKAADVRAALMELQLLAAETNVAVLGIMHLNKNEIQHVIHRVSGSVAFTAVVRTAFLATSDPQDSNGKLFLPFKNNIGPLPCGRRFTTQGLDEGETQNVKIVWGEEVNVGADDALAALSRQQRVDKDGGAKLNQAMDIVRAILGEGPKTSDDLAKAAKEVGDVSRKTLMRARAKLGVVPYRPKGSSTNPWMVKLPPDGIVRAKQQNGASPLRRKKPRYAK